MVYNTKDGKDITIRGESGFSENGYNVKAIGEAIRKCLFRKEKMTKEEAGEYIKYVYPKVMDFFKEYNLKPTAYNVQVNMKAIKDYAEIDKLQKEGIPKEPKSNKKKTVFVVLFIIGIIVLIYFSNKQNG